MGDFKVEQNNILSLNTDPALKQQQHECDGSYWLHEVQTLWEGLIFLQTEQTWTLRHVRAAPAIWATAAFVCIFPGSHLLQPGLHWASRPLLVQTDTFHKISSQDIYNLSEGRVIVCSSISFAQNLLCMTFCNKLQIEKKMHYKQV